MYREFLKPLLFRLDAETAHDLTLRGLALASNAPALASVRALTAPQEPVLAQPLWGQTLASPVGLAAGLDKNGVAVPAFAALGFGFLEVGTVTPLAQAGNDQPRLFRLPEDEALINRMGFNNGGAAALHARLSRLHTRPVPVWVNIGKNKLTPNEDAVQDYLRCVRRLQEVADAFVVNVSSPNTPGLRALQAASDLRELVGAVVNEVEALRVATLSRPPVLVKLAPDLHPADFEASLGAVQDAGASGVIISNTTLARDGLRSAAKGETGGLSGKPLAERSTVLIRLAYRQLRGGLPIVGVGGIFTPQDAYAKIRAGASLVEVYSGLIYEGPGLVRRLNLGLAELLRQDGVKCISEAIGADT